MDNSVHVWIPSTEQSPSQKYSITLVSGIEVKVPLALLGVKLHVLQNKIDFIRVFPQFLYCEGKVARHIHYKMHTLGVS